MAKQPERTQDKIDVLYQWLSYELQQAKTALLDELKISSTQIGSLYGELKNEQDKSSKAISQEIRYSYKQNQVIYDGLAAMLKNEVGERLNSMDEKLESIKSLEALLEQVSELKESYLDKIVEKQEGFDQALMELNEKLETIGLSDEVYQKLVEAVSEKTELTIASHNEQVQGELTKILEAVNALPVTDILAAVNATPTTENVDYVRIAEEVGDKVAEVINQIKEESVPVAVPVEEEKIDYDRIIYGAAEKVIESLPAPERLDYARIENAIASLDMEALAEVVASKILIPEAPAVDHEQIAELVAAKVAIPEAPAVEVDHEQIAELVSTKISVPEVPEIDYEHLADLVTSKITPPEFDYERLATLVAAKMVAPEVDYERIANLVVEKMTKDTEQTCEVVLDDAGIEEIATKVVNKMPVPETIDYDKVCQAAQAAQILPDPVDYDRIAEIVEDKLANEDSTYDLVIDEDGLDAIAKGVSEELCQMCAHCGLDDEEELAKLDELAEMLEGEACEEEVQEEETPVEEELAPAEEVEEVQEEEAPVEEAEEVVEETPAEEPEEVQEEVKEEEAPAEEAEEVQEEAQEEAPAEEPEEVQEEVKEEEAPVEEPEEVQEEVKEEEAPAEEVEEVQEEVKEEAPVEEVESAADTPVEEEIAPSMLPTFTEIGNDLVDAETGLVIRLKRSFVAKMRQSEEKVKGYYSDIKNELTSYKKIKSNVSWHGDRFNYGRDTVAKININGKTLCFYVALDPNDPELKTTVYHQKDVSHQKAYESTPFMVKVKSDVAVKKALRLVGVLADKLGTEKEEEFEQVDYVEEFAYQSTKQLFDEGFIKATKEKKVDFDF